MSEESVVVTAPSVDEAIIIGLTRLTAMRNEVKIEVLDEGSRGFLGLGTREASVRLTRRPPVVEVVPESDPEPEPVIIPEPVTVVAEIPASSPGTPAVEAAPARQVDPAPVAIVEPPAPASEAPAKAPRRPREMAGRSENRERGRSDHERGRSDHARQRREREPRSGDLDRALVEKTADDVAKHLFAGLNVSYTLSWEQEDRPTLWISLRGGDADMLVGPRSQTLNSVQYLFRSLLHRLADGNYNVVVDADGYRKRRQRSLESLARKLADQAVKTRRPVKMRAMPAHERRLVHILLRKDKRVKTESSGRGRDRAITIVPVKRAS